MDGTVVAPQRLVAEEGARVLRRGHNAMDAAVTAAFVQGVADPHMCGLGGGGVMTVHDAAAGTTVVIEFLPRAGARASEHQWADAFARQGGRSYGYVLDGWRNDVGYESIGAPGTVPGLAEALNRFGTLSWAEALAPAIALAREGMQVSGFMRADWETDTGPDVYAHRDRLTVTAEAKRLFTKDGALYEVGERLPQDDLADTLEQLADEGADSFATGRLAQRMSADLAANGSTITADDFAAYRPRVKEPVRSTYRDREAVAAGVPAGGVALIQLLNFLEGYDLASLGWPSAEAARVRVDAMGWTFAEQERASADPEFVSVPVDELLDKDRAAHARERVERGEAMVGAAPADSPTTTHLSVVDSAGNAVALTHTLGTWSGVVTPGLGFGYNNYLNGFDPRPGGVNSLAPGKTRVTMMTPTVVFEDDRPAAVVGGIGANRIVTGVAQTLVNVFDLGMHPVVAVSAPRVHRDSGPLHLEGRITSDIEEALRGQGYDVNRHLLNYDLYFSLVQTLLIDGDGRTTGAADPRGDGGVAVKA